MNAVARDITGLEIAVVGMTCRFPSAPDVDSFWRNLERGVESVRFFSREELKEAGIGKAVLDHPDLVPASAVLDDAYMFDAAFFGYSPREAEVIDPQHRLFLECAWEALERAACDPWSCSGAIGVFAGSSRGSYLETLLRDREVRRQANLFQLLISTDKDYLATRAAYKLDLKGPAVAVQTACSTSLVAVHLAAQSLLAGDCDVALAGGACVSQFQTRGHVFQEGAISSRDGHCRPFDAAATGIVRGQGVGVVVLKRLSDAIADADPVEAVIRGSAVNNDGARKIGFTAPRVEGQAQVIKAAQLMAGVGSEEIGYVEAHGTATPLGDPIEIEALTRVFQGESRPAGSCPIGSVKSNFGHLDTAAGVAGLIKTVLALQNRKIPPSLNFERPNPKIEMDRTPFFVNASLREWPQGERPRVAGVSSFGIGGTNAHAIVEEAPPRERSGPSRPWQLLPISARTPTALDEATRRLASHLKDHPELELADVAFTLARGRRGFDLRRFAVARDREEALVQLDASVGLGAARAEVEGREVAFLFPGQGAQYPNMARGLYESEPAFRESVDHCSALLQPHLGLDLREVLYPSRDDAEAGARIRRTSLAQPALFVVEHALASLWRSWGVRPCAALGHSIGEYVAACVAGVLSLEDALALVAARGTLMERMPPGSMLAVPRDEAEVEGLLDGELALAAINAPGLCVIAGPTAPIEMLARRLAQEGCECTRLHTSHAFHSGAMDPVLAPFAEVVGRVQLRPPEMPYLSNLTGDWIRAEEAVDPGYWVRHLRGTVRFSDAVRHLLADGDRALVEVGPGRVLAGLVGQHAEGAEVRPVTSLQDPRSQSPDLPHMLQALGQLWASGVSVDWVAFFAGQRRRRELLPTYPFERQRFLVEPPAAGDRPGPHAPLPGKREDMSQWTYLPAWRRTLPPPPAAPEGQWLLLDDGSALGRELKERLGAAGAVVTSVQRGEGFARTAEDEYAVDAGDADSTSALVRTLDAAGRRPGVILHLWGAGGAAEPPLDEGLEASFYGLLHLARALAERGEAPPLRLVSVVERAVAVSSTEPVWPVRATATGPCRVIGQELPGVSSRLVDIVPCEEGVIPCGLVDQILAEAQAARGEAVIALRGPDRWAQSLEPAPLAAPSDGEGGLLREGGVYLITGGLGGVGLQLADFLATRVRARLVLVGRTGLPPASEWDACLSRGDEPVGRRIRAVRRLESEGAEVVVAAADVTDEARLREVLADARSRFGRIDGVIHAAGVPGGGMAAFRTREQAAAVLAPKVLGTPLLGRLLDEDPPDFLVLCSSLTALVGGVGQMDYCAANAYLDSFANARAGDGRTRVVSIAWDTWSEAGMAADAQLPGALARHREEVLRHGMTGREGAEILHRILSRPTPSHLAVSTREPGAQRRPRPADDRTAGGETAPAKARPSHPRPALATAYAPPANEVERTICDLWQQSLGIEPIGVEDSFFELGGHSLLALHLVGRVNREFGTDLAAARLYEGLTVRFLAGLVSGGGDGDPEAPASRRRAERSRQQRAAQQSRLAARPRLASRETR